MMKTNDTLDDELHALNSDVKNRIYQLICLHSMIMSTIKIIIFGLTCASLVLFFVNSHIAMISIGFFTLLNLFLHIISSIFLSYTVKQLIGIAKILNKH